MNELSQLDSTSVVIFVLAGIIVIGMLFGFIIYFVLSYRHKKNEYDLLEKQKLEIDLQKVKLEETLAELKATQLQLIQSAKMASLGELTAGIAHEIQNPLNFVNNFSEVNSELIEEMKTKINDGNLEEAKSIADDISNNEKKINQHGKRADSIVKGMLQHSRRSDGLKEATDINNLVKEYLNLAYHGFKAKDKSFLVTVKTDFDTNVGIIKMIPQDIGRVILNLLTNAFYAVNEKKTGNSSTYEPTVLVSTSRQKSSNVIEIIIRDNGNGIPKAFWDKVFQPFFSTKPTGRGTGLGLSISYDIIKAHGWDLQLETEEGEYARFIISIPVNAVRIETKEQ